MKKLTAKRCKEKIEMWERLERDYCLATTAEDHLQAYRIALPVLEQQESGNDGWIEWAGGECPVELPRQEVEYRTRLGNKYMTAAGDLRWFHEGKGGDIIAYRVIENDGRER